MQSRLVIRLVAGALLLTLGGAPAQAALAYTPCLSYLDQSIAPRAASSQSCSVSPGDPLADSRDGAPPGEYIDLVSNVVYRFDGQRAEPVGAAIPAIGYVEVSARYHVFACATSSPLQQCSDPMCEQWVDCIHWRLSVVGCHEAHLRVWLDDQVDPYDFPSVPAPCTQGSSFIPGVGIQGGRAKDGNLVGETLTPTNYYTHDDRTETISFLPGYACPPHDTPGSVHAQIVIDGAPYADMIQTMPCDE